jgi:hypothetical protein
MPKKTTPVKKAKTPEPEVKPEDKPITTSAGQVVVQPPVIEPPVIQPVTVQPTASEPSKSGDEAKPAEPMVKQGELASAIADLAKVVEPDKPVEPAKVEVKPAEISNFEPVGVTSEAVVENKVETEPTTETKKKKGPGGLGLLLAFFTGLALGVVLGFVLWGKGEMKIPGINNPQQAVTPTVKVSPATSPAVTPTGIVSIDRAKIKVQVLNGTGGKGVAAAAKAVLESMGYKEVATGNAEKEDYKETEVAVKKDKTGLFETLKADLSSKYQVATQAGTLPATSQYDAVVTIGTK